MWCLTQSKMPRVIAPANKQQISFLVAGTEVLLQALLMLFWFLQPIQICLWQHFSQSYSFLSIKMLFCQSIHAVDCFVCLIVWQILQSSVLLEDKGAELLLLDQCNGEQMYRQLNEMLAEL